MLLWRISEFADLSGEGGLSYPGRWNHRGTRIIYCADHPATALLEVLVHTDPDLLPNDLQLLKIGISGGETLHEPKLQQNWKTDLEYTRNLWEAFCDEDSGIGFKIPSVLVPHATNYLLNPAYSGIKHVKIEEKIRFPVDERFFV